MSKGVSNHHESDEGQQREADIGGYVAEDATRTHAERIPDHLHRNLGPGERQPEPQTRVESEPRDSDAHRDRQHVQSHCERHREGFSEGDKVVVKFQVSSQIATAGHVDSATMRPARYTTADGRFASTCPLPDSAESLLLRI